MDSSPLIASCSDSSEDCNSSDYDEEIGVIEHLFLSGSDASPNETNQLNHCVPQGNALASLIMQYMPSKKILANNEIDGLPTLHALAECRVKDTEIANLQILVGEYLSQGYDIDKRTNNFKSKKRSAAGFNCLLAAIDRKNVNVVKILITNGADVNSSDDEGYSCLHWCALVNDSNIMELLLAEGADFNVKTKSGLPIIHIAADEGHLEIVYKLLQKDGKMINWVARYIGFLQPDEVDKYPSRYNIDVQGAEVKWCTPLQRAVYMNKADVTKLLLLSGSKFEGLDLLHYSVRQGDIPIANILLSYIPANVSLAEDQIRNEPALLSLPCRCFLEYTDDMPKFMASYIKRGYDINSVTNRRQPCVSCYGQFVTAKSVTKISLLHLAVLHGSMEMIELLIESCGADINILTGDGNTPLFLAICLKHTKIANYLLSKGADASKKGVCYSKYLHEMNDGQIIVHISTLSAVLRFDNKLVAAILNLPDERQVILNGLEEFNDSILEGFIYTALKILDKLPEDVNLHNHTVDGIPTLSYIMKHHFYYRVINDPMGMLDLKRYCFKDLLSAFVKRGYDVNQCNEDFEPLLHIVLNNCVSFSCPVAFHALMKVKDCDPNVKFHGVSALNALLNGFGKSYIQNCCSSITARRGRSSYCVLYYAEWLLQYGASATDCALPSRFCIHPEQIPLLKTLKLLGVSFPNDGVLCLKDCRMVGDFTRTLKDFTEKCDHSVKKLKHIARLAVRKLAVGQSQDEFSKYCEELPGELRTYLNLHSLEPLNTSTNYKLWKNKAIVLELDTSTYES